jgi:hypothetical protein
MSVIAKFHVQRVECSQTQKLKPGKTNDGGYKSENYENVEMRTIVLTPVYSNNPEDENRKFWDASPSGEIKLGTVNPAAWQAFELGGDYYVTFSKDKPVGF